MKIKYYFMITIAFALIVGCGKKDEVNPNKKEKEKDVSIKHEPGNIIIDASHGRDIYFSFEKDNLVSVKDAKNDDNWDLAFNYLAIQTNGGKSGSAKGAAFCTKWTDMDKVEFASTKVEYKEDRLTEIITFGSNLPKAMNVSDEIYSTLFSVSGSMAKNYISNKFVYIIRTAKGKFAKIQIVNINTEDKLGAYTMDYKYPLEVKDLDFEFPVDENADGVVIKDDMAIVNNLKIGSLAETWGDKNKLVKSLEVRSGEMKKVDFDFIRKNLTEVESIDISKIKLEGDVLEGDAFARMSKLKSVKLPTTLKTIEYRAFELCTSLTKIDLHEGLTTIGDNAFTGSGLENAVVPASVTKVGFEAFARCKSLKTLITTASPDTWGDLVEGGVCQYCSILEKVTYRKVPGSFNESSYNGVDKLKEIELYEAPVYPFYYSNTFGDKKIKLILPKGTNIDDVKKLKGWNEFNPIEIKK